jgi:hypothetical protein
MTGTDHHTASSDGQVSPLVYGLLAEFDNVAELLAAARQVRVAGFSRWDVCSPFPIHGLDEAVGARRTRLPWLVLVGGVIGLSLGLFLSWWANATSFNVPFFLRGYPFASSGKPVFSLPANVPVIFELTILFSALTAVVGMLAANRLPRLYHPLLRSQRFARVTRDRFFIVIEAADPLFEASQTAALLRELGAGEVELLRE